MPNFRLIYVLFFTTFGLVSCDLIKSPEQQCLESTKLDFKDPDSLKFISNLGSRGLAPDDKYFWIRYSATNSYGARIAANMACEKNSNGKWERSQSHEASARLRIYADSLESEKNKLIENNQKIKECKSSACVNHLLSGLSAEALVEKTLASANTLTDERIYRSAGPLN